MAKKTFKISKDDLVNITKEVLGEYLKNIEDSKNKVTEPIENCGDIPDMRWTYGSYSDPEFMRKRFEEPIEEGLIRTYDINKTKNIICRRFNLNPDQFQIKEFFSDGKKIMLPIIILSATTDKNTIGEIKHYMQTCGYHTSRENKTSNDGKFVAYYFEPKFSEEVTEEIKENYQFLYHATPTIHLKKILEKGLSPHANNTLFFYPSRVYCMKGNGLTYDQTVTLKNIQIERSRNTKLHDSDNNEYAILRIDISKLPENIQFYVDPMASRAIYTYNNIPPQALTIIGKY